MRLSSLGESNAGPVLGCPEGGTSGEAQKAKDMFIIDMVVSTAMRIVCHTMVRYVLVRTILVAGNDDCDGRDGVVGQEAVVGSGEVRTRRCAKHDVKVITCNFSLR